MGHVVEAKRRVEPAKNQAREIAAIAAASRPIPAGPARVFEVRTPDGRTVRHRAQRLEDGHPTKPWRSAAGHELSHLRCPCDGPRGRGQCLCHRSRSFASAEGPGSREPYVRARRCVQIGPDRPPCTATQPLYRASEGQTLSPTDFAPIADDPAFQASLAGLRADPVLGMTYAGQPDNAIGVIDAVTKDMGARGQALSNAANPGFQPEAAALYARGARKARDIAHDRVRVELDTIETSALYLNLLRDMKRVNGHIVAAAAYPVLERTGGFLPSRIATNGS